MQSDTDRLPQLDEDEFIETIVLDEDDVMATREMRILLDPDGAPPDDADD
ncbi:MAG TPA: hypothetical protein VKZ85_14155 [Woeseiaceae bacterium]|nr:hypothetical protein [Woeseiaceae bacterium]